MILAIDIGNSNIVFGGFEDKNLSFVARISTSPSKTEDEYSSDIKNLFALHGADACSVDGIVISSVVPILNRIMAKAVSFVFGVEPLIVGPGVKTGLNIHCDNPVSVGSDIICACVAVRDLYKTPALIVDMGTATKISVLNGKGAFEGVAIIPGVNMGLNALAEGTAQLPQVSLENPPSVIGKNTADSMRSGIVYGNASLIDGMIDRMTESVGEQASLYATGGMASMIIEHCKHELTVDPHLVLKGLLLIYLKNN